MEDNKLTEFEKALILLMQENRVYKSPDEWINFIADLRQIMPPQINLKELEEDYDANLIFSEQGSESKHWAAYGCALAYRDILRKLKNEPTKGIHHLKPIIGCTPNERKFLDRLKEIGEYVDYQDPQLANEILLPLNIIDACDFPDVNLSELVEKKKNE